MMKSCLQHLRTVRQTPDVQLSWRNLQEGKVWESTSVNSSSLAALYLLLQTDCLSIRVSGSPTLLPTSFHAFAAPTCTYTRLE